MTALGIPTFAKVSSVKYAIVHDQAKWDEFESDMAPEDRGAYGYTHHPTGEIYLDPKCSNPTILRLTLRHELLHCAMETGAGKPELVFAADSEQPDREEYVIRQLEVPTLQLLLDNPYILQWFAAVDEESTNRLLTF